MKEVTPEMIAQWKQISPIYQVEIQGAEFIYRPIGRAEFRNNLRLSTTPTMGYGTGAADAGFQTEELTVQTALLWPTISIEELQGVPAGVISRLAELIMEASGFDDQSQPIQL